MTKKESLATRISRSRDDLRTQLAEQMTLLSMACNSYDSGQEIAAKYAALTLRVLLHQTPKSHSLLGQLKLREGRYLDTAGALNPKNLLSDCNLTAIRATPEGIQWVPNVLTGGGPFETRVAFVDWWNEPVVKSQKGEKFNRRDIIQHVCNTDGGAHVDPTLDEAYMNLSRKNSLGWVFHSNGVETPMKGPELACIRQIAHEVTETLKVTAPWAFNQR
ncbi:hypothetical protein KDW65_33135 [Burkholderia cenocepacia]|uniref:hypothetical protein n=1 Tax=Burkholderia cenocepacia TaxID=95486 RepID=UPI001B9F5C49|nr:hypothetical protein [Burkholderia cenocepacia]MBR8401481.1 hypothetical protein [Burkholderia cenocepacia]